MPDWLLWLDDHGVLQAAGDFSAGVSSALTFGLSDKLIAATRLGKYGSTCSGAYFLGNVAGIAVGFVGGSLTGVAESAVAEGAEAASQVEMLSASDVRFSQSSANGVGEIADSMTAKGWQGAPIDVVQTENGLVTVDNTRLLAAHMTDTPVQAIVRDASEALPDTMAGRFGDATTWGDAVANRIAGQNAAYRSLFPNGSWAVGVGTP